MSKILSSYCRALCVASLLSFSLHGQIAQDHPELCGQGTRPVTLPENITAVTDGSSGVSELRLPVRGSSRSISLPGIQNEIRQVCPIGQDRLVVFAWDEGAYNITVVDRVNGTVVDSFMNYNPVMSPDQHWLIMRRFYSLHTDVNVSEQYLLYDLRASAAENRHDPKGDDREVAGAVVYPVVPQNSPFDPPDVSDAETQRFRSSSFFWAPASQALVFGDSVQDVLSIVLISVTDGGIKSYAHSVSLADVCREGTSHDLNSSAILNSSLMLGHAEVASLGSTLVVMADFQLGSSSCKPKRLTLSLDDFKIAETKLSRPRKRKQSTAIPND
jgi:hypothetical protein